MSEYIAALCLIAGDEPIPYNSTKFLAADKTEAVCKAKDWARSHCCIEEGALLQVNADGCGICTFKPGEF